MKILFAHQNGAASNGTVTTELLHRMEYMKSVPELRAELLFAHDEGISAELRAFGPVHFEPDGRKVRRIVDARGYDFVVVIDSDEYLEAMQQVKSVTAPLVVCELHSTSELDKSWNADGWIVPSELAKRRLLERIGVGASERAHVVPTMIDPRLFNAEAATKKSAHPIILWVGQLEEHENWEAFLEIAALFSVVRPDIELWMIGGATAPEAVSRWMLETVDGLGLMNRFRWFPRIDHRAMSKVYAYIRESGGCALMTNTDEPFDMAVVEALLSGCPVVSSNAGSVPELAKNRPYFAQYPAGDLDRAAEHVLSMIFERGRAVRRALLDDIKDLGALYSGAVIGPRYIDVLMKIATSRSA